MLPPKHRTPTGILFQVPPDISSAFVTWVGVIILSLLLSTFLLTIGYAMVAHYRDIEGTVIWNTLRPAFYQYLGTTDADHAAKQFDGLAPRQRAVLTQKIDDFIALVDGTDRERLIELAHTLGLHHKANTQLDSRWHRIRRKGLKRLSLLRHPVGTERLLSKTSSDRTERELTSDLLLHQADPIATQAARELLLTDEPLSVFGLETLAHVLREDPTPGFQWLTADDQTDRDPDLVSQVLWVLSQIEPATGDVPLAGVVSCLSRPDHRIRAGACLVLAEYGWRFDVREQIDLDDLLTDNVGMVRAAAYHMLATWGDDRALSTLEDAIATESDTRVLVTGLPSTALHHIDRDPIPPDVITWAQTEAMSAEITNPLL